MTSKRSYKKVIPLEGETIQEARARNKREISKQHNRKYYEQKRSEKQKKLSTTKPFLQQKTKELFDMIMMFDKQGKLDEMTPLVNAHLSTIQIMQALQFE